MMRRRKDTYIKMERAVGLKERQDRDNAGDLWDVWANVCS